MTRAMEKQWRSVLTHNPPHEGWIGECLVIIAYEQDAGYTRGSYCWWKGRFEPNGAVPKLDGNAILTHWLDDPAVPPPLPEGWPGCGMDEVNDWLRPYRERLASGAAA